VAWFSPAMVGGGHGLTQQLLAGSQAPNLLALAFVVRFFLGGLSYSAGAPGGLFAPMLVLGAQLGLLFSELVGQRFSSLSLPPDAFVVVGMAAFFTAVVRAPLTGIILIIEMTACSSQLLPMLWACFAAMAVPTFLGNRPIYDSLRGRTVRSQLNQESSGR
jgi:chloride channel protein, CIC family